MLYKDKDRERPSTQLYPQDVVQSTTPPYAYGIIDKCWWDTDEDMHPPDFYPPQLTSPFGPLNHRPLKDGEFGVSFIADNLQRDIKTHAELRLVDRTLRTGDLCKRTIDDLRSGVVLNARVKGRLAHAISGQEIPGWRTRADLEQIHQPELGEYVTYDDWIGQIVEVFDEALIEDSTNNQVVKVNEMASGMYVGERGPDLMPTAPISNLVNNMMSAVFGGGRAMDTVLEIQHIVYAVVWLAINQSLDPVEAEKRHRPKRFWAGKDIGELTMLPVYSDTDMVVGSRVKLKDKMSLPVTQHGTQAGECGLVTVDMYQVVETETELDVLWQDGSIETILARDVVPQLNPDEYECWPGDYAMWKTEGGSDTVIVQSVNGSDRTAKVKLMETGKMELVSLLELDRGASESPNSTDSLGVQRGDLVLVHRTGMTNGCSKARVPRIGELEHWLREVPESGHCLAWRKEMSELGAEIARNRGASTESLGCRRVAPGNESFFWFGEVTRLNLDGTVEVTHCESTTRTYPTERLTVLYDGLEGLHDEMDLQDDNEEDQSKYDQEDLWAMEDGEWRQVSTLGSEDGWEDDDDMGGDDDEMDVDAIDTANGNGAVADVGTVDVGANVFNSFDPGPSPGIVSPSYPSQDPICNGLAEGSSVKNNVQMQSNVSLSTTPSPRRSQFLSQNKASAIRASQPAHLLLSNDNIHQDGHTCMSDEATTSVNGTSNHAEVVQELSWKRFDILPSAPVDHAFYSHAPAQPGKSFMTRLTREYRVLSNSLPDTIVVRAYEDRSDLLRSLIIGPANTPYEDAPFVIDWRLDSNFPNSPPIAHFLSWTNGNGRVNPNLYEEGKVCLSILGTWQGDRNETWSAARSSLLQTLISIQGLVLVKEPWYCEPGYEKLRGTEEGIINSRLYSEKAYVLSRGFVRRALEIPLGGLDEEIEWFYYAHGRLAKVLQESRALVEKSRREPNPSKEILEEERAVDLAIPRLTTGGIILLERTLGKLQELLDAQVPGP